MKNRIAYIIVVTIFLLVFVTGCQSKREESDSLDGYSKALGEAATDKMTEEATTDKSGEPLPETLTSEAESGPNQAVNHGEQKIYNLDDYGTIEEKKQEYFWEETGELVYYYQMEEFFVNDTFAYATSVNSVLQQIYDEYEENYKDSAEHASPDSLEGPPSPYGDTPYDYWHILNLTYVGEDYISIQYNDIAYMGGAHPYSLFDGITIDLRSGEQVFASQLLGKDDEEILAEISNTMGLDVIATWEDVDFYLTDSSIVFFYRTPGFWEDVVLLRE